MVALRSEPSALSPQPSIRYYSPMRINRHKIDAFARFMLHRFLDEGCLQSAGALAFTTLFALVPLVAAVFGILAAFSGFTPWGEGITGFVFRQFVPGTGEARQGYPTQFPPHATEAPAGWDCAVLVI